MWICDSRAIFSEHIGVRHHKNGYEEDQRTLDGRLVFLFFVVTNWSVVLCCSKVKGVALRDALLGDNNNYLRSKNDADLSSVEGLFRPSTSVIQRAPSPVTTLMPASCSSVRYL